MLVITNRSIEDAKGLKQFGKTPNAKGPKELRLFDVVKEGNKWNVRVRDDRLDAEAVKNLKRKYKLNIDVKQPWYASLQAACELFEKARTESKPVLFFIHGYNNDMEDVMKAAYEIQDKHDVIVVPISWPANGGGAISGTAAYLSDKSDARISAEAIDYALSKIAFFHRLLSEAAIERVKEKVLAKHPDNPEKAAFEYSEKIAELCSVRISLLCHSMGNYVFKKALATSEAASAHLIFDNVCLVAADTNSHDHADWVSKVDVRNRLYVVINENDSALKASRIKPGKEQKARLGHYIKNLNCASATYVDLSDVEHMGSEHTYFKGDALRNTRVKTLFSSMFGGHSVENTLDYLAHNNTFRIRPVAGP